MGYRALYDYKKSELKIGNKVLVESFFNSGENVEITGRVIKIYKYFAVIKTKNYVTSVNFI